jgi:hypothetical protein
MENRGVIELRFVGTHEGSGLAPTNLGVKQLAYVLDFLQAAFDGADIPSVKIQEGSLKFALPVAAAVAMTFASDVEAISGNRELKNPKLEHALAAFQKRLSGDGKNTADRLVSLEMTASGGGLARPVSVTITEKTQFRMPETGVWFPKEIGTVARVVDMGGVTPNVHFELPNGERVTAGSSDSYLRELPENYLYHDVRVRIKYEKNSATGEERNFQLVALLGSVVPFDEQAFQQDVKAASDVWAGVDDPAEWVRGLRG